jgi:hypothetical protein
MFLSIEFEFTAIQEKIEFEIRFDSKLILNQTFDGKKHTIIHEFDDSDEYRTVKVLLSMHGKTQKHTVIDAAGNILKDCAVLINSIIIDEIDVTEIFCQGKKCYTHDNNGGSVEIVDEFYGFVGCNGIVEVEFSVPLYKWFLTHC